MGQHWTVKEEMGGGLGMRVVAEGARREGTAAEGASKAEVVETGLGEQLTTRERWDCEVVLDVEGAVWLEREAEAVMGCNVGIPVGLDVGADGTFHRGSPGFGGDEMKGEDEEVNEVVEA
jgi:hypothetical protein